MSFPFRPVVLTMLMALLPLGAQAQGAAETGVYRNLLAGHGEAEVEAKIAHYWQSLFEGGDDERIYYPSAPNAHGPTAYIFDVYNDDVRSEGMSYGMMIAVQMDRKAEFDALWNWAYSHMRYASGPRKGYFRWQCTPTGCPEDKVPASDGEEYIATALLFAAGRWGNGEGIYNYEAEANAVLDAMLHKEDMNGGVVDGVTNMFDRTHKQIVFVPQGEAAKFSDPSYHLPAFYEVWARRAAGWQGHKEEDRRFWREAAQTSRAYLETAAHPVTGLTPDYAEFDGRPKVWDGHEDFRYDAFRSAANWSVDQAWWQADDKAEARTDRIQAFFESQGMDRYGSLYRVDGTPLSQDRSAGLIASNGAASLGTDHPRAAAFVAALWALEPPKGRGRYYNGLLQFMSLLHASGRFKVY
jgi:oligosaccharide reducing-end xylanase